MTTQKQPVKTFGQLMNDIMLINGYRVGLPALPTGLGYIAQAIEDAGIDYNVCDVNLQTHDQILQIINDSRPRYIGCGTMTYEVAENYALLVAIRETMPDVIIIMGGPHAIAANRKIFHECSAIDIVIQGEGEKAIVKLLQNVPLHNIPGVLTKDLQTEPIPHELLDINSISFPRYHKFDLEKYGDKMNIASSRGCFYNCSFCGAPIFLGKKWRAFKVDNMIEEFEYWYSKGYRQFYFSDSLFVVSKKRIINFCTYITDSGYSDVEFMADGVRADHLTFEVLQHMKNANFNSLTLGVESINDETLDFFNKGESFYQIDKAISIADSLGFDISIYIIIGAPNESYNEAVKSIKYPMKYKNINHLKASKLLPIMGTPYYEYAIAHKLVPDENVYYPNHEAFGFNARQNSHSAVDEIWMAVYPVINQTLKFLEMRKQIKILLSSLGFDNLNVERLNSLTQICLNPVLSLFVNASSRIMKLIMSLNPIKAIRRIDTNFSHYSK